MEKKLQHPDYTILKKCGTGEITEKKSRFIAVLGHVSDEAEALAFVEAVRKQHYDARHNCFAYILGERSELERCSDDGEPSGTAGRPMLELLKREGLTNAIAVVTRYFGGTLLGTGGLVRAYTEALQEALRASEKSVMHYGVRYSVMCDYTLVGKLQYYFAQNNICIEDTLYTDRADFHILVPGESTTRLREALADLTGAQALISELGGGYYKA